MFHNAIREDDDISDDRELGYLSYLDLMLSSELLDTAVSLRGGTGGDSFLAATAAGSPASSHRGAGSGGGVSVSLCCAPLHGEAGAGDGVSVSSFFVHASG